VSGVRGVRYSRAFRRSLIVLLVVTLGWKLAIRLQPVEPVSDQVIQRAIGRFFVRHYFTVALAEQIANGEPSVRAAAGLCRILVTRSNPVGWDRELIRRYATAGDQVFVAFRGKVYSEQPTWRTAFDALWTRLKRELGLRSPVSPVLAVVASDICDATKLPWEELATVSN